MTTLRERLAIARRGDGADAGITLVELLVYSVLLVIVLMIAGSLLINSLVAQRDVKARNETSNDMQISFRSMERAVRNTSGGVVAAGGDLLIVRERTAKDIASADDWQCVGYYVDTASESIRRIADRTGAATLAAASAADPGSIASSWPIFLRDTSPGSVGRAFGPIDASLQAYDEVQISLVAQTGPDLSPVEFVSSVSLRPQSGTSLECW